MKETSSSTTADCCSSLRELKDFLDRLFEFHSKDAAKPRPLGFQIVQHRMLRDLRRGDTKPSRVAEALFQPSHDVVRRNRSDLAGCDFFRAGLREVGPLFLDGSVGPMDSLEYFLDEYGLFFFGELTCLGEDVFEGRHDLIFPQFA